MFLNPSHSVSLIIPTRDRPKLLTRAIESVLGQTDMPLEIIVVDDGDGTGLEVLPKFNGADIKLCGFSSHKQGAVAARNLGIVEAQGVLIAFLDDDDWFEATDMLAKLCAALCAANTNVPQNALSFASGTLVYENEAQNAKRRVPFHAFANAQSLTQNNTLLMSGICYPKALHETLGLYDPDLPFYYDWDWYLRAAKAGIPFVDSNSDGVAISVRAGSYSSPDFEALRGQNLALLMKKHGLKNIPLKNHAVIAEEMGRGELGG